MIFMQCLQDPDPDLFYLQYLMIKLKGANFELRNQFMSLKYFWEICLTKNLNVVLVYIFFDFYHYKTIVNTGLALVQEVQTTFITV